MAGVLGAPGLIARLVAVAAGLWLMFAPAVLDYGGRAADNDRTFGPIAASFAFVAIWQVLRPVRWVTLPIGVWLVAAPLVLDHGADAGASSVLAGLAIAVTSPMVRNDPARFAGGWSSVLPGGGRWRADPG